MSGGPAAAPWSRPPALMVALLALMLAQAVENLRDARATWGVVPGSQVLVSVQVLVACFAVALVSPLWRRDRRAIVGFVIWSVLVVAQAALAATLFAAGQQRVSACLAAFGGSALIMGAVAHFTTRWLRGAPPAGSVA